MNILEWYGKIILEYGKHLQECTERCVDSMHRLYTESREEPARSQEKEHRGRSKSFTTDQIKKKNCWRNLYKVKRLRYQSQEQAITTFAERRFLGKLFCAIPF
ncbi:hypothetical protein ABFA07_017689 [Porites harrisoni]